MLLLLLLCLGGVSVVEAVDEGGGCLFLRDERTVRCRNASLAEVASSLRVLTGVVLNRPRAVEVEDCLQVAEPSPFPSETLPSSVVVVRLLRCALKSLPPLHLPPSLGELDLSQNDLSEVPSLSHFHSLRRLHLRSNRIAHLPSDALPDGLQELDLAYNRLGLDSDHDNGYTLKSSLPISDFSVSRATALESLVLRGNRLAVLPDQLMGDLAGLRHLDLSHNELQGQLRLPPASTLESLDLRSNRIQGLQVLYAPALNYLDFTENPLHCNCSVLWMRNLSNATHLLLPPCHSPDHLKGSTLAHMPTTDCPNTTDSEEDHEVVRLIAVSSSRIEVEWRGPEGALVYRRAEDPPQQMTLVPALITPIGHSTTRTQTINDLRPSTPYVVCVARVQRGASAYTIDPSKCGRVSTPSQSVVIRTRVEDIYPSDDDASVNLRWRLEAPGLETVEGATYRHEWRIRVRRTGSDNYTDIPVYDITSAEDTDGQLYEYSVRDLAPRTHYDVCLGEVEREANVCVTVRTEGGGQGLYPAEAAAVAVACALCLAVGGVTIALCGQRGMLPCHRHRLPAPAEESQLPPPFVEAAAQKGERNYSRSWSTLRLPEHHVSNPQELFRSFRTPRSYRDALTSVTIYSSGYSEC